MVTPESKPVVPLDWYPVNGEKKNREQFYRSRYVMTS